MPGGWGWRACQTACQTASLPHGAVLAEAAERGSAPRARQSPRHPGLWKPNAPSMPCWPRVATLNRLDSVRASRLQRSPPAICDLTVRSIAAVAQKCALSFSSVTLDDCLAAPHWSPGRGATQRAVSRRCLRREWSNGRSLRHSTSRQGAVNHLARPRYRTATGRRPPRLLAAPSAFRPPPFLHPPNHPTTPPPHHHPTTPARIWRARPGARTCANPHTRTAAQGSVRAGHSGSSEECLAMSVGLMKLAIFESECKATPCNAAWSTEFAVQLHVDGKGMRRPGGQGEGEGKRARAGRGAAGFCSTLVRHGGGVNRRLACRPAARAQQQRHAASSSEPRSSRRLRRRGAAPCGGRTQVYFPVRCIGQRIVVIGAPPPEAQ